MANFIDQVNQVMKLRDQFLNNIRSLQAGTPGNYTEPEVDTAHSLAEANFDKAQMAGAKQGQQDILRETIKESGLTDSVYDKNYKNTVDYLKVFGKDSNKLTFRNPNEGEAVGAQEIRYMGTDGKKHTLTLLVPQKEVVGYGNIRGWGSPENSAVNSNGSSNYNPVLGALGKRVLEYDKNSDPASALGEGVALLGALPAAAIDTVVGRPIALNATKQDNSYYDGEDKAVGLGKSGESEGQIFGAIDDTGATYGPKEVQKLLEEIRGVNLLTESPKFVQEHKGPAYVPGDILLSLLGLQPNRGAVSYNFPEYNYSDFVKNYRGAKK